MKNEIPFGPFIIIGNLIYIIFMDEIFNFLSMPLLVTSADGCCTA